MCRPSNIDVKLGCYSYLLKILILTIAVCELRPGFALQCFHLNSDAQNDRVNVDVDLVGRKAKALVRTKRKRKLRLATWNFSVLCSDRKQKEVGELLAKHNLDVVAGQESWEKEETRIAVEGYKWFGKPPIKQNSPRGDGGVGFLVRECLVNEVEFINTVKYEESVWMKIRSERGREALCIGCVYMPTGSTSVSVMESCYERLKEDVLSFREKGKFALLGDFNARVGRSAQINDVVGMLRLCHHVNRHQKE